MTHDKSHLIHVGGELWRSVADAAANRLEETQPFIGTVKALSGNLVQVQRSGDTVPAAGENLYPRLAGGALAVNDVVLVVRPSGSPLVVAKIGGALALNDLDNVDTTGQANDQVLAYESAQTRWIPRSIDTTGIGVFATPVLTGWYYNPTGVLGLQAASTYALDTNRAYVVPVIFNRTGTVDQIGLEITTAGAAGSTIRMTMRSSASDNAIADRLITTSPAAVSATTTGVKTFVVSQAVLKNTVYYLEVAAVSSAPTPILRAFVPSRDWFGNGVAGSLGRIAMRTHLMTAGWTEFPLTHTLSTTPTDICLQLSARLV